MQFLTLVIGIALASGLWIGVQAINAEARASYDRAAAMMGQDQLERLERSVPPLTLDDFAQLRRMGWLVSPILQGSYRGVQILGIDPFSAPPGAGTPDLSAAGDLTAFLTGQVGYAAPETVVPDGVTVRPLATVAPGVVVVDIAHAQRLLRTKRIDGLLVLGAQPEGLLPLAEVAPDMILRAPEGGNDLARLTDSFHLNLTAFGLLAFAVGLFIVHAAIGLAFEQRRGLFRTLRALGMTARGLVSLLVIEITVLAVLGGALGVVLGYLVAGVLLPGVAATLSGLYGASVSGSLSLPVWWWATGLGIAVVGALAAAAQSLVRLARMPILASAMPRAWARASAVAVARQAGFGVGLILVGLALAIWGRGLIVGFVCLGAFLLGSALVLPAILSVLTGGAQRLAKGPIAQLMWADTRQQLPGLSLALMALMLALAANVGVSTMVGSFRGTFTGWLDQRLASELYITTRTPTEARAFEAWVTSRADAVLPIVSAQVALQDAPGDVYGIKAHSTYSDHWPLLSATPDVWQAVEAGSGILINEQLARRAGLDLGDPIALPGLSVPVVGVYSDYGNPTGQAIVGLRTFTDLFPSVPVQRFALRTEDASGLRDQITGDFGLPRDLTINQSEVKAMSLRVFEQTFLITGALNVLTLGVAAFALWASLTTLAGMRLPQLAPVWALGLTRRRLAWMELLRTLGLALLTAVIALPVGLILAWILLAVVNVEAFGWRLPMQIFPGDWVSLGAWAMAAAALSAALPVWRLARIAPAQLLQVFSNAR